MKHLQKILLLIILVSLISSQALGVVSHDAEHVMPGILGQLYPGNWAFMNGSVGIGIISPTNKLHILSSEVGLGLFESSGTGLHYAGITGKNNDGNEFIGVQYGSGYTTNMFGISRANFGAVVTQGATSAGLLIGAVTDDPVIFGQNNTEVMRIDSSGNVGIGTTNPGKKLEVVGDLNTTGIIYSNGLNVLSGDVILPNDVIGNAEVSDTISINNGLLYALTSGNVGIGTTNPLKKLDVVGNLGITGMIYANGGLEAAGDIIFPNNAIENAEVSDIISINNGLLYALTSGNVGIGTTSPVKKLDVIGDTNTTGTLYSTGLNVLSGDVVLPNDVIGNAEVSDTISINNGLLYALTSGNVGIGTISPVKKLNVVGDLNTTGTLYSTGLNVLSGDVVLPNDVIGNAEVSDTISINNGLLYALTSGNVGIGTTSPNQKLEVVGNLNVTGTSYLGNIEISADEITANSLKSRDGNIIFKNSIDSEKMRITSDGDVGIGTSNPNQKLDVIGNLNVTGTLYAHNISGNSPIVFVNDSGSETMRIDTSGYVGIGITNPAEKLDVSGNIKATGNINVPEINTQDFCLGGICKSSWSDIVPQTTIFSMDPNEIIFKPSGGSNDGTDTGTMGAGKDTARGVNCGYDPTPSDNSAMDWMAALPISTCNLCNMDAQLQFDLSQLPAANKVAAVYLGATLQGDWKYCYSNCEDIDFYLAPITESWVENDVSATRRSTGSTIWSQTLSYSDGSINEWSRNIIKEWDITQTYKDWKNGVLTNNGLMFYSTTSGCNNAAISLYFATSDHVDASKRPFLRIVLTQELNCTDNDRDGYYQESECGEIDTNDFDANVNPGVPGTTNIVGNLSVTETISSNGLNINGTVTATTFIGDGSALTNIDVGDTLWINSSNNATYVGGNVGIGTTTPSAKLDVEVSTGGAATIGSSLNSATGAYAIAMGHGTNASGAYSTAMGIYTGASGVYSTAMGFDTTASGDYSTAMGSNTVASGTRSTATGYNTTASGAVSTAMGEFTTASGSTSTAIGQYTTASEIRSIAIGTRTTASGIQSTAMGTWITVSGQSSFGIGLNNSPYTLAQNNAMAIMGGNVGIGTVTPDYTLTVAGTAWVTNGAWSGSDLRWKKNIIPLNDSLNKITKLQGVNYDWRVDEFPEQNFINNTQVGLIAQDVEEIIPEVVTTNNDGYKGISYEKLVPVLIEGIKELKIEKDAEISFLKQELCNKDPSYSWC